MADDPNRTASGDAQGEGSEALDWTKPLPDPKMEKMRLDMVRQHNAKLQEAATARESVEEERQTLRQEVEDAVLAELQERGALDGLDDTGGKKKAGEGDEELTEAQVLQRELAQVKADFGSLKTALNDERVQREMDRLRGEIVRGMGKHPQIFPSEDADDESESAFLSDCIDEVARAYVTSGDAQRRAPVAKAVKKVADKIAFIRTRGKSVTKVATGDGGQRRSRPEGDGGSANVPDDLKDMGLDDPQFLERVIAHSRESED